MEINKQLFEDVLSGKLKGTFVLRNNVNIKSTLLERDFSSIYPYKFRFWCILYTNTGLADRLNLDNCNYDIVDFIPNTDMKENELTIEIPEGYCIDESKSTFDKIVFKKKDTKPRSWKEYCEQQQTNNKPGYYFNDETCQIQETSWYRYYMQNEWKNVLPSKELAEAFLAMMQLMSLRQAWIGDWKPDWFVNTKKYVIQCEENKLCVDSWHAMSHSLSFPTQETAEDFMDCFKDLLEIAKPLI